MLFDLTIALCEAFPAMSPFSVRHEKAQEVFLLVKRLNNAQTRKNRGKTKQGLVRKPASDTWF